MSVGKYAVKKILQNKRRFKAKKNKRFTIKANKAPLVRGIVLKVSKKEAQQPNSAQRTIVIVNLFKNMKKAIAYAPGDGAANYIFEHSEVLLRGSKGILGRSPGDLSNLCFKVECVDKVSLKELVLGKKKK